MLNESVSKQKDSFLEITNSAGMVTRPALTLLQKFPTFQGCSYAPPHFAKSLNRCIINLPSIGALVKKNYN